MGKGTGPAKRAKAKTAKASAKEPNKFTQHIRNFAETLVSLREFVGIVEPVLREKRTQWQNHPKLLELQQMLDTPSPKPSKGTRPKKRTVEDLPALKLTRQDAEALLKAIRQVTRGTMHGELLMRSSLLSLTITVETLLAKIFRWYYAQHPEAMGQDQKFFSLSDLLTFDSVEDARAALIEDKVEKLMRGTLDDWLKFFDNLKVRTSALTTRLGQVEEVFQRRNLIVHNDGVVNSIYIAKVPSNMREGIKSGQRLGASRAYLWGAIDVCEVAFIGLISDFDAKLKASPAEERAGVLFDLNYEHMMTERWHLSEKISDMMRQDRTLSEDTQLRATINYWQSIKWQGRDGEIANELKGADFSAKDDLFKLCLAALREDKKAFLKLLTPLLGSEKLPVQAANEWPVFRRMRELPEVAAVIAKRQADEPREEAQKNQNDKSVH
jgi:hypothetical protein